MMGFLRDSGGVAELLDLFWKVYDQPEHLVMCTKV